jgi:4-amino-4-deoxy-L-arabinose transferase-like glycosyltransferase
VPEVLATPAEVQPSLVRSRPARIRIRPTRVQRSRRTRRPWWSDRILSIAFDICVGICLFIVAFNANTDAIDVTAFHPDETRWLNRSYYILEVTDPYGSTWQNYYVTRGQPPLGSYVMGIGQWVQDGSLHPNLVWDFFYSSSNWNQIAGAMPSDDDLRSGRRTSAFVGGLAVLTAYFVTRRLTNPVGGAVAAFLLAWNGLSIRIGSQALSDQTLLLTLGLSLLAAFQFVRKPTWPWAIVLGVTFGLGGAAKLTPLLLSLAAAGYGGLLLLRWLVYPLSKRDRKVDRLMAVKLILQPVIAFAAFVLVYPYLWPNPIRRTWNLYDFRIQEMESQGRNLRDAKVEGLLDTFQRISNGFNLGGAQQTSWKIIEWVNERFGTDYEMIRGLDLTVAAAAVPFLILIAIKYGLRSPHFLIVALLGAEAAIIVIGLRSDLYRYYLPIAYIIFVSIGVMVGVLTGFIGRLVTWKWRRNVSVHTLRARRPQVLQHRLMRNRRPRAARRAIHYRVA